MAVELHVSANGQQYTNIVRWNVKQMDRGRRKYLENIRLQFTEFGYTILALI